MTIEIRPLSAESEYLTVEQLQREIWGAEEIEIIPRELLLTAQKKGGVLLGAFDRAGDLERMVGFVFGFVGLQPDGGLTHCSQIAGVVAGYRDRQIGYALKLAQRAAVLAQGIELMTWTFDPLESRNARFNFHKLGATCQTYWRNHYGAMRDALNAGLPSDRFEVEWRIASPRVEDRLERKITVMPPSALRAAGVPLLDPLLGRDRQPPAGDRLLVRIPANFQQLKAADRQLALAWRQQTRALFEEVFALGFAVTDLLVEGGESFYLLERGLERHPSFHLTGE